MAENDYRFQNKALKIHLTVITACAFFIAFTPLYTIHVTNPNKHGEATQDISEYAMYCYVFRATIPHTDCTTGTSLSACYNILDKINRQECDTNKLIVGSENLEEYSVYTAVAALIVIVCILLGFLSLLFVAAPSTRKNDFHKVAAFFHFLAAIAALVLADTVISTVQETNMEYTTGIGQVPITGPALYIICILPLIELIIDNFHPELI